MSIDKCTPGKWELSHNFPASVFTEYGKRVADCGTPANAKLIASSKDMYEVLYEISKLPDSNNFTLNRLKKIASEALPKL